MTGWLKNMEQLVEWELAGKTEALGEISSQYNFIHHNPQMVTEDRMWRAEVGSQQLPEL